MPLRCSARQVARSRQAAAARLAAASSAWALGWWGGADSILLMVLGLRQGWPGIIAGALFAAGLGLAVMIRRGRSLTSRVAVRTPPTS